MEKGRETYKRSHSPSFSWGVLGIQYCLLYKCERRGKVIGGIVSGLRYLEPAIAVSNISSCIRDFLEICYYGAL